MLSNIDNKIRENNIYFSIYVFRVLLFNTLNTFTAYIEVEKKITPSCGYIFCLTGFLANSQLTGKIICINIPSSPSLKETRVGHKGDAINDTFVDICCFAHKSESCIRSEK